MSYELELHMNVDVFIRHVLVELDAIIGSINVTRFFRRNRCIRNLHVDG